MSELENEIETNVDEIESVEEISNFVEGEELDEVYKPVNQLQVPQEAIDYYEQQGFDLHWVRVFVPNSNGEYDFKNIQKKESDHYEFVPRDEVPGLQKAMTSFFGSKLNKDTHGLYIVGDLALAKIRHGRLKAKRQYLDGRIRNNSQSVINDLKKNKAMPESARNEGWKIERTQPKARETQFGK